MHPIKYLIKKWFSDCMASITLDDYSERKSPKARESFETLDGNAPLLPGGARFFYAMRRGSKTEIRYIKRLPHRDDLTQIEKLREMLLEEAAGRLSDEIDPTAIFEVGMMPGLRKGAYAMIFDLLDSEPAGRAEYENDLLKRFSHSIMTRHPKVLTHERRVKLVK
jgi:hypothetical protein